MKGNDNRCEECEIQFESRKDFLSIVLGVIIYAIALFLKLSLWMSISLFLISYLIISKDILWKAIKNIFRGRIFDENFLLSIATIGAFIINKFAEGVAVMLFFRIGEMLQNMALNRSRRSIKSLLEIKPEYANLKVNGIIKRVSPAEVNVGDIILVKPGEKIPLDGIVIEGSSFVDASTITGESMPMDITIGDDVISGMINKNGLITIKVTRKFKDSTVSRILTLVEKAANKKSLTEKFITKFARYYTPAVVFSALLIAVLPVLLYNIPFLSPLFSHRETFSEWLYKSLIFLVISCPCALVISIPLGFFGGIGACSRRGVLVKGSNYLEGLNKVRTIVWDKTGTLTKGVFRVSEIVPENGFFREEILKFAALAESHSNHPIAQSICSAYDGNGEIERYEEIPGYGVVAKIDGNEVIVGNDRLLHRENIEHNTCNVNGTAIHVAINGKYAGYIVISDEIKEDAFLAIKKLREGGVKKHIMLTGDKKEIAEIVSQKLGIDEYFAELLPHEKVEKMEELMEKKDKDTLIAFVGDGINDAPVLSRADIGIAVAALGSDAAMEAADIVLMGNEVMRVYDAIKIAGKTRRIVWENIFLAIGIKGLFMGTAIFGFATMWEAVFADVGVALIALLNSIRILR